MDAPLGVLLFVFAVCLIGAILGRYTDRAIVKEREVVSTPKQRFRERVKEHGVIVTCHRRALVICGKNAVSAVKRDRLGFFVTFRLPESEGEICCRMHRSPRVFTIVYSEGERLVGIPRKDHDTAASFREACINAFEEVVSLPVSALYG